MAEFHVHVVILVHVDLCSEYLRAAITFISSEASKQNLAEKRINATFDPFELQLLPVDRTAKIRERDGDRVGESGG